VTYFVINEYKIKILRYKKNLPLLNWYAWATNESECKLTKAVVLNSFPHGRFWQFVYKENVRCTRLMQRSLQVVIRQMFVLCSNYWRSSIKIAHFIPIRWQTWSPQTILVSDWPISNNLLLWNCLAKWAELWWEAQFERRRFYEIDQLETRIVCGNHVC
jgi:hypothetical protein